MTHAILSLWDSWSILGRVVTLIALAIFLLGLENIAIKLVADIQGWRRRGAEPTVEQRLHRWRNIAPVQF